MVYRYCRCCRLGSVEQVRGFTNNLIKMQPRSFFCILDYKIFILSVGGIFFFNFKRLLRHNYFNLDIGGSGSWPSIIFGQQSQAFMGMFLVSLSLVRMFVTLDAILFDTKDIGGAVQYCDIIVWHHQEVRNKLPNIFFFKT